MTVKKAIRGLDMFIENKLAGKKEMLDPEKLYNKNQDCITSLVRVMVGNLQNDIEWLQAIKRQLLPEQHRTKIVCRHPKKDHDTDPDGRKYCMNCNANLS